LRIKDIHIRDPFILPEGGRYYMYGSTISRSHGEPGFDAYVGDGLDDWIGARPAFRPRADFWGLKDYWAAEVHGYRGEYYLFGTFTGADGVRGVGVLKSGSPGGPFADWSMGPVTPAGDMCLDGSLHVDASGDPWLVYCHEWIQAIDGEVCAVRLSGDLARSVGGPTVLFKSADVGWSVEAEVRGVRGWITDGCFIHRMDGGGLVMLWSCACPSGYCQNQARSVGGSVMGPWEQAPSPLYADDGGHGMVFRPFGGGLMMPLHKPNKSPLERAVLLEVEERGGWLAIVGGGGEGHA